MSKKNDDLNLIKEELVKARQALETTGECRFVSMTNETAKSEKTSVVLARFVNTAQLDNSTTLFPKLNSVESLKTSDISSTSRGWAVNAADIIDGDTEPRVCAAYLGCDYDPKSSYALILIKPQPDMNIKRADAQGLGESCSSYLHHSKEQCIEALEPNKQEEYRKIFNEQINTDNNFNIYNVAKRHEFIDLASQKTEIYTPASLRVRTDIHVA